MMGQGDPQLHWDLRAAIPDVAKRSDVSEADLLEEDLLEGNGLEADALGKDLLPEEEDRLKRLTECEPNPAMSRLS